MKSLNQVTLMGNLTRDPEVRQTPGGQNVCSFSLALNSSYKAADGEWKEKTDYIDIVAWGPLGDNVAKYLTKGRPAIVSGRLQSRNWEQDGVKRTKVEVTANDVIFINDGGQRSDAKAQEKPAVEPSDTADAFPGEEPINLDDIPF